MSELTNTISLVLGDWSHDGHGHTDTVVILSNLTNKQIESAYKKGTKKVGFDFIKDVASDYEDSKISEEQLNKLISLGLKGWDKVGDESDEDALYLYTEAYADIYLFIVKLGNEEFEYKILEGELNPEIHIGGYGMYGN